jgi:hypothetical protein
MMMQMGDGYTRNRACREPFQRSFVEIGGSAWVQRVASERTSERLC